MQMTDVGDGPGDQLTYGTSQAVADEFEFCYEAGRKAQVGASGLSDST